MTDEQQMEAEEAPAHGGSTLWVTDSELIRRSGVPERVARNTIRMLDGNPLSGFPTKNPHWGDRRYYPAVKAFWERTANPQPHPQARQVVTFRDRKTASQT